MSSFVVLLIMSALLGLTAFGVGMLPLSISFSRKHLSQLTTLGTGLLLGTALGVILPEGIETLALANPDADFPTTTIALSLLAGFSLMLLVEQLGGSHSHSHPDSAVDRDNNNPHKATATDNEVDFDVELGALEDEQGIPRQPVRERSEAGEAGRASTKQRPLTLTIGLVLHGLADGLALGVSVLSSSDSTASSELSFVVFLALAIHKAPTSLAFTTSLLATSLPRLECRKHLAVFSASTPIGAIVSYGAFSFIGAGDPVRVGIALLVSGGSFLYVATVLQPVSHQTSPSSTSQEEMGKNMRMLLLMVGMFTPFVIGSILEHGHDHLG